MTDPVRQEAILARAREAVGAGSLQDPDARVIVENPVCGDRITMEIRMAGGTIESLAYDVRGCLLCEAAASLVGVYGPGSSPDEIARVHETLLAMLDGTGGPPSGKWDEITIFAPVAEHRNRHHCVLLPFDALIRVLDAARGAK